MDNRIDEIERGKDPLTGRPWIMVHLKNGSCLNDEGTHTFGEDTMAEVKKTMARVKPCNCPECK